MLHFRLCARSLICCSYASYPHIMATLYIPQMCVARHAVWRKASYQWTLLPIGQPLPHSLDMLYAGLNRHQQINHRRLMMVLGKPRSSFDQRRKIVRLCYSLLIYRLKAFLNNIRILDYFSLSSRRLTPQHIKLLLTKGVLSETWNLPASSAHGDLCN